MRQESSTRQIRHSNKRYRPRRRSLFDSVNLDDDRARRIRSNRDPISGVQIPNRVIEECGIPSKRIIVVHSIRRRDGFIRADNVQTESRRRRRDIANAHRLDAKRLSCRNFIDDESRCLRERGDDSPSFVEARHRVDG